MEYLLSYLIHRKLLINTNVLKYRCLDIKQNTTTCPDYGFTHIWPHEEIKDCIWTCLLWSAAQMTARLQKSAEPWSQENPSTVKGVPGKSEPTTVSGIVLVVITHPVPTESGRKASWLPTWWWEFLISPKCIPPLLPLAIALFHRDSVSPWEFLQELLH